MYERIRSMQDPVEAWNLWRSTKDELYATHPQSPIPGPQRDFFSGLPYFEYTPEARVLAEVIDVAPDHYDIATSGEPRGTYGFTRFAEARFQLLGEPLRLELYWLDGYGGGLFLPFRDGTSGKSTYGAGRYLLDTVKGADLGDRGGRLVLDFNFSYNPSCCYDPSWVCPLAPPPNRLVAPIEAGERIPEP